MQNTILNILVDIFEKIDKINLNRIKILEEKSNLRTEKVDKDKVSFSPHLHDYFSFFIILDGCCDVKLKEKSFNLLCEDFVIIPPNQTHQIIPSVKKSAYKIIWFAIDDIYSRIHLSSFSKKSGHKIIAGTDVKEGSLIKNNLKRIITELSKSNIYNDLLIKAYLTETFIFLIRNIKANISKKENKEGWHKKLISEAKNFIEKHYKSNIAIADIANTVRLTPNYFSILFKQDAGINVSEYLITTRLKKAKELLDNSKLIIKEISEKVGYSDPYYFSRIFKKFEKISPQEYRNL